MFFSFKLYADPKLKQSIGSALYTCNFNFNQQATYDAFYNLNGSTLFASGPVDFTDIRSLLGSPEAQANTSGSRVKLRPTVRQARGEERKPNWTSSYVDELATRSAAREAGVLYAASIKISRTGGVSSF